MSTDSQVRDPYALRDRILALDPVENAREIAHLFHRDFQRALLPQIATGFFATISPPRMTRILIRTGELEFRNRKRLVDQMLIHHEMLSHGFVPGRGRDALRRMNEMHHKYAITAEDFTAVSVETTLGQLTAAREYGWRELTEHEVLGVVEFERVQALHMNIRDVPATVAEMVAFRDDYFDRQVRFAPSNRRLAESALRLLATVVPAHIAPRVEKVLMSLTDPRIVAALGYDYPDAAYRERVHRATREHAARDATDKRAPQLVLDLIASVYPDGYEIDRLGTHLRSDEQRHGRQDHAVPPPMCPV
ncbi:hypothetical protein ND748_12875 [Frankia sp. AiPs1]|jgi:hypothetical protein|uniref:hypothetical protein n=1 Tax=Frankia sp. AiPs1 TaxID=573493 RepID=UPI0020448F17|nr:hypothetical protein [Frankia sp. AiPs1]MCM3922548.1 hypothetical protein [Frankia sp. AiPs1]